MDPSPGGAERALGVGIVGAGGFGRFIRDAMATLPNLRLVAVYDPVGERAASLVAGSCARIVDSAQELLDDPAVGVVVIATPPGTHAELTVQALRAGRHVFCEKPSAISAREAAEVAAQVAQSGLVYVVDHVIHYNPLVQFLHRLRAEGVLGEVQRFVFENDAGDSELGRDHWFWDPSVSGGIFLEHGVHFFDVARLLIGGEETEVQSMAHHRRDGRTDTVVATVRHGGGALATHAHGFSHANAVERQLMRVDFGLSEARLAGWIPLQLTLDAWLDEAGHAVLQHVVDDPSWLAVNGYRPNPHQTISLRSLDAAPQPLRTHDRDHNRPFHDLLTISLGRGEDKQAIYQESVRAALADLAGCVSTGGQPQAGIDVGAAAVEVAHAATLALDGSTRPVVSLR